MKRLAVLLLSLLMLLSMNGCMSLYLLSEQIDPDGMLLAEETVMPQVVITPNPEVEALPESTESITEHDAGIKFSDMVYTRPDTDAIYAAVDALEALLDSDAADVDALLSAYQTMLDLYNAASDEMSMAYVLYSFDVTDDRYKTEYDDLVVALTDVDVRMTDVSIRLFDDPRTADAMLRTYGEDFIRVVRDGRELNSPEIQPFVEREQKLTGEYDTLRTTFVYEENGKSYTMEDIAAIADSNYEEYVRLYDAYYAEFNRQAGDIYLQLVELRDEIAKTLGFSTYTDYQYRCYSRDYTPEDARKLHAAVKKHIVPLYYNAVLSFYINKGFDALEAVVLSEQDFMRILRSELSDVSPEARDALDYMLKNELYTTTQSNTKMESSYSTYLGTYDSPFLFTEWTDPVTSGATMMHELGHFTRFCIEPADAWSVVDPLDILEIDSQGLEMMLVHEYDDFYGAVSENAKKNHLIDGLYALITGCMEDEFQQAVYADPDMTLEEMNVVYKRLADEYGMTDLYGFVGTEWAIIPHSFQSPLYYISYAVSVIPALELYVMADADDELAAETYSKLLHRPVYAELRETMDAIGLSDPMEERTVQLIAQVLEGELIG